MLLQELYDIKKMKNSKKLSGDKTESELDKLKDKSKPADLEVQEYTISVDPNTKAAKIDDETKITHIKRESSEMTFLDSLLIEKKKDDKEDKDDKKHDDEGKCGEGKCGEGKCGEGKCGEGKCGEGKCGKGKCGDDKDDDKDDTVKEGGACGASCGSENEETGYSKGDKVNYEEEEAIIVNPHTKNHKVSIKHKGKYKTVDPKKLKKYVK